LKNQIAELSEIMAAALLQGRTIFWIGNGGSAADAQHLAAELVGKLRNPRPALASIALSTNGSVLTALANDDSFESVFSRQVEALARPGDVVIGISTSGNSKNVIRAVRAARALGAFTAGWTGRAGGALARTAQLCLCVPSNDTQRIQEAHIAIGHIVCGIVEDLVAANKPARPARTRR